MNSSSERLKRMLCKKIYRELQEFKREMMQAKNKTVIENAYAIVSLINIYEELRELTNYMSIENLKALIETPDLLKFFYSGWLETQNSFAEEIRQSVVSQIPVIREYDRRTKNGYAKIGIYS